LSQTGRSSARMCGARANTHSQRQCILRCVTAQCRRAARELHPFQGRGSIGPWPIVGHEPGRVNTQNEGDEHEIELVEAGSFGDGAWLRARWTFRLKASVNIGRPARSLDQALAGSVSDRFRLTRLVIGAGGPALYIAAVQVSGGCQCRQATDASQGVVSFDKGLTPRRQVSCTRAELGGSEPAPAGVRLGARHCIPRGGSA
jgi:hypothetical protein